MAVLYEETPGTNVGSIPNAGGLKGAIRLLYGEEVEWWGPDQELHPPEAAAGLEREEEYVPEALELPRHS